MCNIKSLKSAEFKSINFYQETDKLLFKSILSYYLNTDQLPKKGIKKQGLFEKFFNFFDINLIWLVINCSF